MEAKRRGTTDENLDRGDIKGLACTLTLVLPLILRTLFRSITIIRGVVDAGIISLQYVTASSNEVGASVSKESKRYMKEVMYKGISRLGM